MPKLQIVCGNCGHARIHRLDTVNVLTPAVELDTDTDAIKYDLYSSRTEWESLRPAQNPPEFMCDECYTRFIENEVKEGIEYVTHPTDQQM